MNKYKVCVYAICKNEEHFVDRWVDSMNEADMIVACDTGSSDNTVEKLRGRGVNVYSITVDPWRFDLARNISMDFIPTDVDICVCTDLDEVLETGWREKLEKVWDAQTTKLRYMYTWKFNEDGSRGLTYWYEKIHAREGYRWVHPVHEVLQYSGEKPEKTVSEATIQLNHFPDDSKSRGQYLPLLELAKEENPEDGTTVFWLGREYMFYSHYDLCIKTLKEYLLLPTAVWDQERCAAMRYISRCYKAKGNLLETKKWLYRAIGECPTTREPYVEMAQLGYGLNDWLLVYYMVEQTLKIKEKPDSYLVEELCWGSTIYDLGAIACYWMEMFEKAYDFVNIAAKLSPNDERIQSNYKLIKEKTSQFEKGC